MRAASSHAAEVPGFEIVRRLGSGGMGVVYEAREPATGATLALKTLREPDAALLQRLKREWRALQGLHHRNIVRLGELRQDGDRWCFTMELVDGDDLLTWVRGGAGDDEPSLPPTAPSTAPAGAFDVTGDAGPVPARLAPAAPAATIARLRQALGQLADGLEALHGAGLVHRDLKPSNILVARDGRVVILDFGLVHDVGDDASGSHAVGTVAYMAPEQGRGDVVTPAADWYAVGVLIYQVLVGRPPFVGVPMEILAQKQAWVPVPPSASVPGVPPDLDELCLGLLAPDAAARWSAAQVRRCAGGAPAVPAAGLGALGGAATFVGRVRELAAIDHAAAAVTAARPVVVVIEGESGVGKSALCAAAVERLVVADPRTAVLHGRCFDRETAAYAGIDALVDALTEYLRRLPAAEVAFAMPRFPALLRRLFPVTAALAPVAAAPSPAVTADTREVRARAFAAYRELFQRLGEQRRIVLVIDDAQWLTEESWAFVAAMVDPSAPGGPAPVMLVLAGRAHAGLLARARELGEAVELAAIALGPLDDADSAVLVRGLASGGPAAASVGAIVREARGHPLFLQELVRAAATDGGAAASSLEDALARRLDALAAPARDVVQVVAAATAPLPRVVLAAATGLSHDATAAAVAALGASRLLASADETPLQAVRPYHDRIRAAALRALDDRALRAVRYRLAEALEAHDADASVLATEWAHAGEPRRAARHAERAAVRATRTLAFERAAHMYRLALAGTDDAGARVALLTSLGEALAAAGHSAQAAEAYLEGARDGTLDEVDDLLHRGAEQLVRSGQVDAGKRVLAQVLTRLGLPLLEGRGAVMRALAWRRVRLRLRPVPPRVTPVRPPERRALLRIDACFSLGDMMGLLDPVQAAAAHAHGLLLALDARDPFRVARSLCVEAAFVAMTPAGRPRGRHLLARAATVGGDSDRPELPGWLALGAGLAAMLEGSFADARRHLAGAETVFAGCVGAIWETATARQLAAWNLAYLGEVRELRARVAAGVDEAAVRDNRLVTFNLVCGPSHLTSLADHSAVELLRACDELLAGWDADAYPMMHLCALFARVHALLYLERGEDALALLDASAAAIRRSQLTRSEFYRVDLQALRARTLTWLVVHGRGGDAVVGRARDTVRALRRERAAWAHALAAGFTAALAAAAGQGATAGAGLAAAAAALETAGLRLHAAAARHHLGLADDHLVREEVRHPATLASALVPFTS